MTVQFSDTGKTAHGTLKSFSISLAAPNEVSMGSSTLPTTEGATNQVSFTIGSGDLPTITPSPISMKYLAAVIVSGKCNTAATISYRVFKNGSSLVTSTAGATANQFWTHTHWRWFDVQVGDVLDVRVWSNQADTTIDYCALQIYPANIFLSPPNVILKDLNFAISSTVPNPFTGAGVRATILGNSNTCILSPSNVSGAWFTLLTSAMTIYSFMPNPTVGLLRMSNGGDTNATSTTANNNATQISIVRNGIPPAISFREVLR